MTASLPTFCQPSPSFLRSSTRWLFAATVVAINALTSGCATSTEPVGTDRKEVIFAVNQNLVLLKVNAGKPWQILEQRPVIGLPAGETLLGIDYRVARGVLYALSSGARLYTLNTATGQLTAVGPAPIGLPLTGVRYGFDFNPAADRIRVVSDTGLSMRLHPDTGTAVDGNPSQDGVQPDAALSFAPGDVNAGRSPTVVAAAYTYNKKDEKLTTNFAIDRRLAALVRQGSVEGVQPVVSPNTGSLTTIGSLGLGELMDASFDIADVSGSAFAAVRTTADGRARLYLIDLTSGRAQILGTVGDGTALLGMAVEP